MKEEINYRTVCFNAMEVMKRAAALIREQHQERGNLKIQAKGEHNFVTEVDKEAEMMLVTGLIQRFSPGRVYCRRGNQHAARRDLQLDHRPHRRNHQFHPRGVSLCHQRGTGRGR